MLDGSNDTIESVNAVMFVRQSLETNVMESAVYNKLVQCRCGPNTNAEQNKIRVVWGNTIDENAPVVLKLFSIHMVWVNSPLM